MEKIGQVNCYMPYKHGSTSDRWFVVNLSNGTTPFIRFWNDNEYTSTCYRLEGIGPKLTITRANYRPTKAEFDTLLKHVQDHVLNGGLLCSPLAEAKPLPDDPVQPDWEYEQFQQWALFAYGRRLPVRDDLNPI